MNRNKPVLVVDDDPNVRDVIATVLEEDGYNVEMASNGAEALARADEHPPSAIILDARMPIMDGWEFLARWRTRPSDHRAPVLVVSATGEWRTALDLGAKDYLSKPFDIETLETTLADMLDPASMVAGDRHAPK